MCLSFKGAFAKLSRFSSCCFNQIYKFSHSFLTYFLSVSGTPTAHILSYLKLSSRLLVPCSFIHNFFLCALVWMISTYIYLISIAHFCLVPSMLLIITNKYFILDIIFFSFWISIWFCLFYFYSFHTSSDSSQFLTPINHIYLYILTYQFLNPYLLMSTSGICFY